MAAEHDDLVFQLRIPPGYLVDGIEAVFVVAGELGVHVHLDGDRDVGLQQAVDASVGFNRRDYNRNRLDVLALVAEPSEAAAAVDEDGPPGTAVVLAITARKNYRERMFLGQEL